MEDKNSEKDLLRKTARWAILFGASIFTASVLVFLVYQTYFVKDSWLIKNVAEHFAATVGLPMAGIASLCIVLVLEFSSGPIELQALGVKFKGASGPIILWILCFSVIAAAIKVLW